VRAALIVYWVAIALLTHWPMETGPSNERPPLDISVDKLIHFGMSVALTTLLTWARPLRRGSFEANLALAVAVATLYSLVDEATQSWFGRTVSFKDIVANLIGVVCVPRVFLPGARPGLPRSTNSLRRTVSGVACLLVLADVQLALTPKLMAGLNPTWGSACALLVRGAVIVGLLAVMRPAGAARPGLNVVITIAVSAGAGLLIVWGRGSAGDGAAAPLWHFVGVLPALGGWLGLIARESRAEAPDHSDWTWPPILAPVAATRPRHFAFHALLVSGLTFASRITGLVRDAVMAAFYGMGTGTDAFFIAFLVPNLFRRLFGEGALSASFIPVYSDLIATDRVAARKLASLCVALLVVVLGVLTLAGEGLLALLASVPDRTQGAALAIALTMRMLPYMPMICLVAFLGAVLQVHGRFAAPAAAPILLNVMLIAGIVVATQGHATEDELRECIRGVALCVLAAGAFQLLWLSAAGLDVERFTGDVAGASAPMRRVLAGMAPMLIGLAVFQVNVLLDSLIAWGLSPKVGGPATLDLFGWQVPHPLESGSVAALSWAQRLYQFPLGVFGVAIATAVFPALARAAPKSADADATQFAAIVRQGLRLTVFIGLPASVGLILVRLPLARLIFERGLFDVADAQRVASILAGYAAAVWAYSMAYVVIRAFYALEDAATPMRISLVMVACNVALNLTLVWKLGAAGLAWSTAACAVLQVVLLLAALRRRPVKFIDRDVGRSWRRSAVLTAVMAAVLLPLLLWFDVPAMSRSASAVLLAVMVALGGGMFLFGAWMGGATELTWLRSRGGRVASNG
jgi:putative peptidoglycan lipid II flippase